MPSTEDILAAIIFGIELLLRHDFGVAGVPDSDGGGIVGVFFLVFVLILLLAAILPVGVCFCGVCFCGVSAGLFFGLLRLGDFFFPFGHTQKNRLAIFGPGWLVKRNCAH